MSSNIADIGAGSAAKLEARAVPTVEADSPSVRAVTLRLHGTWNTFAADVADKRLRAVDVKHAQGVIIDTSGIEILDTAGAWLLDRYARELRSNGVTVDIETTRRRHDVLLQAVSSLAEPSEDNTSRKRSKGAVNGALSAIGSLVYSLRRDALMGLHILGAAISGPQLKAGRPNRMSWAPLIAQIEQTGVRAIPIIMLMSFIIGAIIAQQGAFQLRYFGAEIFVVDLVSILVLREIGVLITAIMVAGRSGSAITAEIGSMRMREEIDALTVIGLNPVAVLVFPRILALMIALPLLAFLANITALAGAMVVADIYSGISYSSFIARLQASVDLTSLFSGLIKAPFMGLLIAVIASVEGLQVEGSAESLGRQVTASVVKAIFLVILLDGIFAIFFAAIDF